MQERELKGRSVRVSLGVYFHVTQPAGSEWLRSGQDSKIPPEALFDRLLELR